VPYIKAKMTKGQFLPYEATIPAVVESDHPRFTAGTKFDFGFVDVALEDGWTVTIEPHEVNRSNCSHPNGFWRAGIRLEHLGEDYHGYWCRICHARRYILIGKGSPDWLPTEHDWDRIEDIGE